MSDNILERVNSPNDLQKLNLDEKYEYAKEARDLIIDVMSENGGHLASNLGVVELTIALHSMFNSPEDKIIWDVSHQCYTHKLITGRYENFKSIRTFNGLSGFTNKDESCHDYFTSGHAGNSISLAMGLAKARDLANKDGYVVVVIGDGSISNGMAFEALNNINYLGSNVIIILNDNEMSISKNVGALSACFSQLRLKYKLNTRKSKFRKYVSHIPYIKFLTDGIIGVYHGFIRLFQSVKGVFFQELGLTYLGPFNGHKIEEIEGAIAGAKLIKGSVLIHLITQKGRGYEYAEEHPDKFHGVSKFNIVDGIAEKKEGNFSFTDVFSRVISKLAGDNEKICAITAAMPDGTGLKDFSSKFPSRFYDVGIAEEHAVSFAAGLAKGGMVPFVCMYSTFLQRTYDQISHDVCMQNLPVIFAIDRSGLVGEDGCTHHGIFDISYLRSIPNLTIASPKDGNDLEGVLKLAVKTKTPFAIRYPRGASATYFVENSSIIELGRSQIIKEALPQLNKIAILTIGRCAYAALKVADILKTTNIEVCDMVFVNPLDTEYIKSLADNNVSIFTLEENVKNGGFGSSVLEYLSSIGKADLLKHIFAIPDEFVEHGTLDELRIKLQLTPYNIAQKIKSFEL